jgi:hypothetical protein
MTLAPVLEIEPRQTWTRATLAPRDWVVHVPERHMLRFWNREEGTLQLEGH